MTEAAWLAAATPVPTGPKSERRISAGHFYALFARRPAGLRAVLSRRSTKDDHSEKDDHLVEQLETGARAKAGRNFALARNRCNGAQAAGPTRAVNKEEMSHEHAQQHLARSVDIGRRRDGGEHTDLQRPDNPVPLLDMKNPPHVKAGGG